MKNNLSRNNITINFHIHINEADVKKIQPEKAKKSLVDWIKSCLGIGLTAVQTIKKTKNLF